MAPLVYGIPFVEFKVAAVARIMSVGNGIFGTGDIADSVLTPKSQKIKSIFDGKSTNSLLPRFGWGDKSGTPDGDGTTVFGQAGTSMSITGHLYSGWQNSSDEIDEIAHRLAKLFHHQPITLTGFTALSVSFEVISVVPDPVGHHGIFVFRPLTRVTSV